jgi:hypothetical protein
MLKEEVNEPRTSTFKPLKKGEASNPWHPSKVELEEKLKRSR